MYWQLMTCLEHCDLAAQLTEIVTVSHDDLLVAYVFRLQRLLSMWHCCHVAYNTIALQLRPGLHTANRISNSWQGLDSD